MTETCSLVALSSVTPSNPKADCYGATFPTTLSIINGSSLETRPGIVGEIAVRGPTVFRGYWNNRKSTSEALWGGWFRTGDLGFLNDRGAVVVLGRKEDMIISGGENIYPAEIESALREHDSLEEAVVVGVKDPRWGERVEAVVIVRKGFLSPSASELTGFLRKKIGRYKVPKGYHFWTSIPKTSSGKTRRKDIRELLEEGTNGRRSRDR